MRRAQRGAAICADVLLESDRRGIESHGCNRFKPIYIDRIVKGTLLPVTDIEINKETPTTVVLDAHDGMGMVASRKMMKMLIGKAKTYGMAGRAIKNSTHYSRRSLQPPPLLPLLQPILIHKVHSHLIALRAAARGTFFMEPGAGEKLAQLPAPERRTMVTAQGEPFARRRS